MYSIDGSSFGPRSRSKALFLSKFTGCKVTILAAFHSNKKQYTTKNGVSVSPIGFDTWKTTFDKVCRTVSEPLVSGHRHSDCAFIYENEAGIGEVLTSTDVSRNQYLVTTRFTTFLMVSRPENTLNGSSKIRTPLYTYLYLTHRPTSLPRLRLDDQAYGRNYRTKYDTVRC